MSYTITAANHDKEYALKRFMKHLCGGAALIVVSLLIGIAYNTFIDNKLQLFPKIHRQGTVNAALSDTTSPPAVADTSRIAEKKASVPAVETVPEGIQGIIPLEKARALYDGRVAVFIDARGVEAFDEGHIAGAMNVPYDQLVEFYEMLTATVALDQLVVVYCWSPTCDFADSLASELVLMGYTSIVIFRGGWEEWQAAGHPTEPPGEMQ
jgi:rhodanese-related sulfurtransferase